MPFWPDGLPIPMHAPADEPAKFVWRRQSHVVTGISMYWRIHTEWWTDAGEVWRDYYEVTTDTGWLAVLYHDLIAGDWRLERVLA